MIVDVIDSICCIYNHVPHISVHNCSTIWAMNRRIVLQRLQVNLIIRITLTTVNFCLDFHYIHLLRSRNSALAGAGCFIIALEKGKEKGG
nr:MAG TPA: hypothetical protein [Caudoviricetes sp.]